MQKFNLQKKEKLLIHEIFGPQNFLAVWYVLKHGLRGAIEKAGETLGYLSLKEDKFITANLPLPTQCMVIPSALALAIFNFNHAQTL